MKFGPLAEESYRKHRADLEKVAKRTLHTSPEQEKETDHALKTIRGYKEDAARSLVGDPQHVKASERQMKIIKDLKGAFTGPFKSPKHRQKSLEHVASSDIAHEFTRIDDSVRAKGRFASAREISKPLRTGLLGDIKGVLADEVGTYLAPIGIPYVAGKVLAGGAEIASNVPGSAAASFVGRYSGTEALAEMIGTPVLSLGEQQSKNPFYIDRETQRYRDIAKNNPEKMYAKEDTETEGFKKLQAENPNEIADEFLKDVNTNDADLTMDDLPDDVLNQMAAQFGTQEKAKRTRRGRASKLEQDLNDLQAFP